MLTIFWKKNVLKSTDIRISNIITIKQCNKITEYEFIV